MRYIVIGAGAIGASIAAQLHIRGQQVLLVARGAQYQALSRAGLFFATPMTAWRLPIEVVAGPADVNLRRDDVLIVAVKTQDCVAALDAWAQSPVDGGGTAATELPVICAQNGVESERIALRRFRNVYAMFVWLPASYAEHGSVTAWGAPTTGILHVGVFPRGVDALSGRIASDLAQASFVASSLSDVMRWKYGKLLSNLSNAVEALCGADSAADHLYRQVLEEGETVLAAAGIDYMPVAELVGTATRTVEVRPVNGAVRGGSSSWQSLARRTGSIESDYLNGEIVLLGRTHEISTPVNETVQRVAAQFAARRQEPGTFPLSELNALIAARRKEVGA